jgi:hypothetical protein
LFRHGVVTGYDFENEMVLSEEVSRPQVEAAIRARYSLPPDFLLPYKGDLDHWSYEVGRYKFNMKPVMDTKKPIVLPYLPMQAHTAP